MISKQKLLVVCSLAIAVSCGTTRLLTNTALFDNSEIVIGAAQIDNYLPTLQRKSVGLVVNQTSTIGNTHLADTLLSLGIRIQAIFAPEHGFRGVADAGATILDGKDIKTGIPIISLYGNSYKPDTADLKGIDLIIFDIQDVGARFYTYISTMHYVMEACAENNIEFMVLDRPNPNGHYVDGPVLDTTFRSFVGLHRVPVVHGMTIGEYAQMVNSEGWLKNSQKCNLKVVPCQNYDHNKYYKLPTKPSPNIPNIRAVYLYPSLCFFEGTPVSVGRGTNNQFQVYGHPSYPKGTYEFKPAPMLGANKPLHDGMICKGYSLADLDLQHLQKKHLDLEYLIKFYEDFPEKDKFFNNYFDKLAGTDKLRNQIIAGASERAIRNSWQEDLAAFKAIRSKYLLYLD